MKTETQAPQLRQPHTGGKLNGANQPIVTTQPAIRATTTNSRKS